jgi:DNA ligase (NAD+)
MYSAEETRSLQKQTKQLLDADKKKSIAVKELETLRNVLRFHEHRYYILNDPLVSDFEYDQLYKALEKIESENPKLITKNSPTQRVAKGLTKDFPTVQHLVPMLSLNNSYNSDDLIDFDRKAKELTGKNVIEYCVEPKFDGGSISLIYENDFLVRGATRGDGVRGDEVTTNVKQIKSIPLSANFSKYGIQQVEIRGEVLINKTNFKNITSNWLSRDMRHLQTHAMPPVAH